MWKTSFVSLIFIGWVSRGVYALNLNCIHRLASEARSATEVNSRRIFNFAHRGYSSKYPENTLLAFEEGMRAGADGFECDLRLTADGEVVIFHDDDLRRLCSMRGKIESLTWSEVEKLRVNGQEKIPRLDEILSRFHTTRMNLELKPSDRVEVLVESVLRVLTKIRPTGPILISSFSLDALKVLSLMDPERKMGKLGILVEKKNLKRLPELSQELNADTWNVPLEVFRFEKKWSEGNLKIPPLYVWTVDHPREWRSILESTLPFEGIITNRPAELSGFLQTQSK